MAVLNLFSCRRILHAPPEKALALFQQNKAAVFSKVPQGDESKKQQLPHILFKGQIKEKRDSKRLYDKLQHRHILLRHFKRFPLQICCSNSVDPGT